MTTTEWTAQDDEDVRTALDWLTGWTRPVGPGTRVAKATTVLNGILERHVGSADHLFSAEGPELAASARAHHERDLLAEWLAWADSLADPDDLPFPTLERTRRLLAGNEPHD